MNIKSGLLAGAYEKDHTDFAAELGLCTAHVYKLLVFSHLLSHLLFKNNHRRASRRVIARPARWRLSPLEPLRFTRHNPIEIATRGELRRGSRVALPRQDEESRTVFAELAVDAGRAAAPPRHRVAGAAVPAPANAGAAAAERAGGTSCGESRGGEWAKKSFPSARDEAK